MSKIDIILSIGRLKRPEIRSVKACYSYLKKSDALIVLVNTIHKMQISCTVAVKRVFCFLVEFMAILPKISDQSVEKQKSYAILNDRLETFDRYCMYSWDTKMRHSEYLVLFLDPQLLNKSIFRFDL
jgi:hypothetical protein